MCAHSLQIAEGASYATEVTQSLVSLILQCAHLSGVHLETGWRLPSLVCMFWKAKLDTFISRPFKSVNYGTAHLTNSIL